MDITRETIILSTDEYKRLLHCTVGVAAYCRAARRQENAVAAADKAVEDAYQTQLARQLAARELTTHR